jgi:rubrerythrin
MTQEMTTQASSGQYPVDDATYNLLQALTSKLEAIEAYEQYQSDDPEGVFGELIEDERRHAQLLLDSLRTRLSNS